MAESVEAVSLAQSYMGNVELPQLTEESTLSDYLTYAALNNPGLRAAFSRWKAALEKIPQVSALPDPRFNYAYFIREVETRVGPQRQRLSLSQMFPWFGKLNLRGDAAAEAANVERQRYEAAKLKLFYEVKNAYYEYYYLARAIEVIKENLELLKYLESVARTKYRVGTATHSDLVKAQVEIGKLEDRLSTVRDLRTPVVARLNAALNRPTDTPLPWPKEIPEEAVVFSDEEIFNWLKENNPELKAIDFQAEKEKIQIELAKKDFYPDITFGLEVVETDEAVMPGVNDSGKDPVMAMISLNLPIWHGKYWAAVREARARYAAVLDDRIERENTLLADTQLALYNFRDAERKIDLYRDTLVPKAEQSFNVAQQGYAAATVGFLDLIDAERILLEFQLGYERALASRAQRLAELEMLIGKEIPREERGSPSGSDVGQ